MRDRAGVAQQKGRRDFDEPSPERKAKAGGARRVMDDAGSRSPLSEEQSVKGTKP